MLSRIMGRGVLPAASALAKLSESTGRASSCPPSPPQQQPTVAPSFSCACCWATRKPACGLASTMAPLETTSLHRTPARAAASGMRASCRQPPTAVHREAQRRAERVEDTERILGRCNHPIYLSIYSVVCVMPAACRTALPLPKNRCRHCHLVTSLVTGKAQKKNIV